MANCYNYVTMLQQAILFRDNEVLNECTKIRDVIYDCCYSYTLIA